MLNCIKADLYRLGTRISTWLRALACITALPVMIIAAGGQYEAERLMAVIPAAVYLLFILVALMLTEGVFGEDKRLGLYKNDTTSGISRAELFLSKYFTSALSASVLWSLCSALCALALTVSADGATAARCFGDMFSLQSIRWFLMTLVYIALFQTVRVLVAKQSVTLLICAGISGAFSQIMRLVQRLFPALGALAGQTNTSHMSVMQTVLWILLPLLCGAIILAVGCKMFEKSEF